MLRRQQVAHSSRPRSPSSLPQTASAGLLHACEVAKRQRQEQSQHGGLEEEKDLQEALRSTVLQYLERVEVSREVHRQEVLHRKAVQYVERVAVVREQQQAKLKNERQVVGAVVSQPPASSTPASGVPILKLPKGSVGRLMSQLQEQRKEAQRKRTSEQGRKTS